MNSQTDRILERLQSANGAEVAMPELARAGAANDTGFCMVHSRIADLRKRGHAIPPARVERQDDGSMHSFYRLPSPDRDRSPVAAQESPDRDRSPVAAPATASLTSAT